jgi:hypothetical protein
MKIEKPENLTKFKLSDSDLDKIKMFLKKECEGFSDLDLITQDYVATDFFKNSSDSDIDEIKMFLKKEFEGFSDLDLITQDYIAKDFFKNCKE